MRLTTFAQKHSALTLYIHSVKSGLVATEDGNLCPHDEFMPTQIEKHGEENVLEIPHFQNANLTLIMVPRQLVQERMRTASDDEVSSDKTIFVQRKLEEAERKLEEAERKLEEAERKLEEAERKLEVARTRYPFEGTSQCPLCEYVNGQVEKYCEMHRVLHKSYENYSELNQAHHELIRGTLTDNKTYWTLHLDKYERDNLLWLLMLCWQGGIEPFNFAATGDWIGQVPQKLAMLDENGQTRFDSLNEDAENYQPNQTNQQIAQHVDFWLAHKINPESVKKIEAERAAQIRSESTTLAKLREKLRETQQEIESVKRILRDEILRNKEN